VNGGERRALLHYVARGYRPVGANVRCGGYELDLIVRRGRRLVFVEVKEKRGKGFGDPLEMVDAEKQRRVRRAAIAWLARRRYDTKDVEVAFEVVGVRGRRLVRVQDDLTASGC
jgi:putative endonuclease